MAKESGIGMTLAVDDGSGSANTITDDCTNLTIGVPRGLQDVSGLADAGVERILLLADCSVGLNGVFNDAGSMSHVTFKTVPSQGAAQTRLVTIVISGQTFTAETMAGDYALTRGADGSFTWAVTIVNADGNIPAWS